MNLLQKIKILSKLGEIMRAIGTKQKWPGFSTGINEAEYNDLVELTKRVKVYNGWFIEDEVRNAFTGIGGWLNENDLTNWVDGYAINEDKPKAIALIMAGNIPLVGFHDFLAVFLSGNKAVIKLSSDDKHLFPALIHVLSLFDPKITEWVEIKENKLEGFDGVIATGSDNSANYFHSYFGKYPNVIRKNRTSIAVLNGQETKEELIQLGHDIFTYFGLGCRNVSQVWIPKDFEVNRLYDAFFQFNDIVNHNKYANNYDYNKAVYLMNLQEMLDNGFLLLKEDQQLNSPLGMLHYARYSDLNEVKEFITENEEKIQVVVGHGYIPFGKAQNPALNDFADGVDTLSFLTSL
ncbi:MAG: acyl-CoA reductase [Crocinitomix sp.]|nr:acyl-CoA reductase [Crocinitomix sp.]